MRSMAAIALWVPRHLGPPTSSCRVQPPGGPTQERLVREGGSGTGLHAHVPGVHGYCGKLTLLPNSWKAVVAKGLRVKDRLDYSRFEGLAEASTSSEDGGP